MTAITIVHGDITQQHVDAIVNAANSSLMGGGGVDGAIHRVAGPELQQECARLGGCRTGEAKMTSGYHLPAKYVIHTVGPVYGREHGNERELLALCYRNSLKVAAERECNTIAFPAISTGAFGYPHAQAATIAIKTVSDWIAGHPGVLTEVRFVLYSDEMENLYRSLLHNV